MPTGYTAKLYEGEQSFKAFALECARAFGALVELRDEPMGQPIPESLPKPTYHKTALTEALRKREAFLRDVGLENAELEATAEYERGMKDWQASKRRRDELLARYQSMLQKVTAFDPPTDDHLGYKQFMVEQLEQAIKFDCYEPTKPVRKTGEEWAKAREKNLDWSIAYHEKEAREEEARWKDRNEWLKQLRQALDRH